jgi:hypothetical protein
MNAPIKPHIPDIPVSEDNEGLREGDLYVPLNKKIKLLIVFTNKFIVFLDENYSVQWDVRHQTLSDRPDCWGEVMNQVALLEAMSLTHFGDSDQEKRHLLEFRRLLGEGVSRMLENKERDARDIFSKAETLLQERSEARARLWFVQAAIIAAGSFAAIGTILWVFRDQARIALGIVPHELLLTADFGALGALFFVLVRLRQIPLNASQGRSLHWLEGSGRIAIGFLGALFLGFCLKADLLAGIMTRGNDDQKRLAVLAVIAFVAGASERLAPSMIDRVDTEITKNSIGNSHGRSNKGRSS